MDGSRALYGIAKDGMTIRQFGRLNRFRVPALAMTVDAVLNILLISFFNNPIEIIAVSNIGYVFATCAALSASCCCARTGRTGRARCTCSRSGCRSARAADANSSS